MSNHRKIIQANFDTSSWTQIYFYIQELELLHYEHHFLSRQYGYCARQITWTMAVNLFLSNKITQNPCAIEIAIARRTLYCCSRHLSTDAINVFDSFYCHVWYCCLDGVDLRHCQVSCTYPGSTHQRHFIWPNETVSQTRFGSSYSAAHNAFPI